MKHNLETKYCFNFKYRKIVDSSIISNYNTTKKRHEIFQLIFLFSEISCK